MANQAWQIVSPGKIALNDLGAVPTPGPGQVLVRVHAVSFNYRDVLIVDHMPEYPLEHKPNLIPGCDGAGVVEASGEGSIWKKSDRVVIHPNSWKTGLDDLDFKLDKTMGGGETDGTFRRYMIVNDDQVIRAPEVLSLEESSTIFTAGLTAYRALFYGGKRVGPGTTVLTQGTGGVSCYAIHIASAAGATVVATSSSDEKLKVAKELGATHLINYRQTPNWADEVLKATDGKGIDVTVEVVGAESLEQTIKCTARGGVAVIVGILSQNAYQPVNIAADVLFGVKTIKGHLGAGSRELAEEFVAFIDRHPFRPPIARTFAFEEAEQGLEAIKDLPGPGKIVMRC